MTESSSTKLVLRWPKVVHIFLLLLVDSKNTSARPESRLYRKSDVSVRMAVADMYLVHAGSDVLSVGGGHGLYANWVFTTDCYISNHDGTCLSANSLVDGLAILLAWHC